MKESEVISATTKWVRHDRYYTWFTCKNRFLTAFKALLLGRIKIRWYVPATSKRKGIYIKGIKETYEK